MLPRGKIRIVLEGPGRRGQYRRIPLQGKSSPRKSFPKAFPATDTFVDMPYGGHTGLQTSITRFFTDIVARCTFGCAPVLSMTP
jgi:hypothetical protein